MSLLKPNLHLPHALIDPWQDPVDYYNPDKTHFFLPRAKLPETFPSHPQVWENNIKSFYKQTGLDIKNLWLESIQLVYHEKLEGFVDSEITKHPYRPGYKARDANNYAENRVCLQHAALPPNFNPKKDAFDFELLPYDPQNDLEKMSPMSLYAFLKRLRRLPPPITKTFSVATNLSTLQEIIDNYHYRLRPLQFKIASPHYFKIPIAAEALQQYNRIKPCLNNLGIPFKTFKSVFPDLGKLAERHNIEHHVEISPLSRPANYSLFIREQTPLKVFHYFLTHPQHPSSVYIGAIKDDYRVNQEISLGEATPPAAPDLPDLAQNPVPSSPAAPDLSALAATVAAFKKTTHDKIYFRLEVNPDYYDLIHPPDFPRLTSEHPDFFVYLGQWDRGLDKFNQEHDRFMDLGDVLAENPSERTEESAQESHNS